MSAMTESSYRKPRLALESTLLVHGVPGEASVRLARELADLAVRGGAEPVLVGVGGARPGREGVLDLAGLEAMLSAGPAKVNKLNTGTLGAALHAARAAGTGMAGGAGGATTVSATMELAAGMGIRVFATGGLGGVHKGLMERLDISTDLVAFTRFPVAVVTAGCKSILDVIGTREFLETLGVPVIGFRCDRFPAFYRRDGGAGVDARFDDVTELGAFVRREMARTRRGVVVCNPIPVEHELAEADWARWLAAAEAEAVTAGAVGRAVTPAVLGALHRVSGGATLRANIELVKSNVEVGARLAAAIGA